MRRELKKRSTRCVAWTPPTGGQGALKTLVSLQGQQECKTRVQRNSGFLDRRYQLAGSPDGWETRYVFRSGGLSMGATRGVRLPQGLKFDGTDMKFLS